MKISKTENKILTEITNGRSKYSTLSGKRINKALESLVAKNLIKCIKTETYEYPAKRRDKGIEMVTAQDYYFAVVKQ